MRPELGDCTVKTKSEVHNKEIRTYICEQPKDLIGRLLERWRGLIGWNGLLLVTFVRKEWLLISSHIYTETRMYV